VEKTAGVVRQQLRAHETLFGTVPGLISPSQRPTPGRERLF